MKPINLNRKFALTFLLCISPLTPSWVTAQALDRPLSLSARQLLTSDSNALQLSSDTPIPASYGGGTRRSDLISSTSIGGSFQDSFGTQNVLVKADLGTIKRSNFGVLDSTTYGLLATQSGDWNPAIYSTLNFNTSKVNTSLANQVLLEPNSTTSLSLGGTLGYRFDPTWSVYGGLDQNQRENSSSLLAQSNTRSVGKEAALRYQPLSGIDGSIVLRRVDVKFPNSQANDLLGNPLGSSVNNTYHQNQLLFRTGYQPNAISNLTGEIGYSNTRYVALSQRNSGGLIFRLNYNYSVSDAWDLTSRLSRDNTTSGTAFASSVLTNSAGFAAVWKATGRTNFRANVEWITRDFSQDAGVAQGLTANRKDTSRNFGVGANYELLRSLNLTANFLKYSRGSSIPTYSMGGHSLSVGLDFNLR